MGVHQLRIHGVGGSPGAALLGVSPEEAVVTQRGRGTEVLARTADPTVEGYDWGRLTTDSRLQPLWVLLLPFTLVNVAGWGHEQFAGHRLLIRLTRLLVHASAVLLTTSYVLWAAIICADYLGYQALGRVSDQARVVGVVLGFSGACGVVGLLGWIGHMTRRQYEQVQAGYGTGHRDGLAQWQADERLDSSQFFAHDRSLKVLLAWHVGAAVIAVAVATGLAWVNWGQPNLGLGQAFLVVGALQFLVIAALAGTCWNPSGRFPGQPGSRALPAAAVTLAVALSNGVWAGVALLIARLSGLQWTTWGQELALIESFVITLLLWGAALAIWVLVWRGTGNADELPARTTDLHQKADGVTNPLRAQVASRRGWAQAAKRSPQLLCILAALFMVSSLIAVALRIQPEGLMSQWLQPPERGVLSNAAVVMLPGLAVAAVCTVWLSHHWAALRGLIGMLWDVLTFWPRRYHPFAVRPYTERAIPEFQALIVDRLKGAGGLIVSAHSQGSVLAFATLAPMGQAALRRCGLLSYGSPLTTLYGHAFPAYFGHQAVEDLVRRLSAGEGGWVNLYRLTDEIGGPVIGDGDPTIDYLLPDPAEGTSSLWELDTGDPEPLRPAWTDVAGHQWYHEELAYKQAVAHFKTELGP